ncbi:TPA: GIY-YIG nuclease family protein [Candidatus Saccharibacteria bacterium]|nr:GIY-YIG nuclease family protein [Candidatus Saccharibacteria bacterium]HIO87520.1 GIY-YIG nuclease family protein [Candidatus Saccharibacteria bacterium]
MAEKFYVYILKSTKQNRIYIGHTQDVTNRLHRHNSGYVKSTQPYRPWILLELHPFKSRNEAVAAEKYFKTSQQREFIKKRHQL